MPNVFIKVDGEYTQSANYYRKINGEWSSITQSDLVTYMNTTVFSYGGNLNNTRFEIAGPSNVTAETCSCVAVLNGQTVSNGVSWSITSGVQYATIDTGGTVTILSTADESEIEVTAQYNGHTATLTMNITFLSGSTSETTVETVTDSSGNTTTTTTTTTENEDGSSTETTTTVITDESGNTVGSTEVSTETNADGSYTGTTTNYDSEGNAVDGTNVVGDTSGNVSTQDVEYDESGNTVVTSYTIDTSGNPNGEKTFNGDGINTEYYAFDMTHGFVVELNFTIDFSNQPAGQNENHHQIISAKRATPTPWYGFQIRQTGTNKYIQLGTQFATGSNTNTTISAQTITNNVAEYNITITYDPTVSTNTFVCYDNIKDSVVYTSNNVFPDIDDLKYLKVTLGHGMDENGDPYRYSNIDVKNFVIRRLNKVADPAITCDGMEVTITCATQGADIYYRLGNAGLYSTYTAPISISADTVVYSYAELNGDKSNTVSQLCVYDNGIENPVITCDGMEVTITCATQGTTIYYKREQDVSYSTYNAPFSISADTVVYAYAEYSGLTSSVVSATCVYDNGIEAPVIYCDGENVTITCNTPSVDLYYKLNQETGYTVYDDAITISADTVVYAYAELNGATSNVVSATCVYSPIVLVSPVITCDGEFVTITCETQDSTILYKIGQEGTYAAYTVPFSISADTTVYAYSQYNGQTSTVVSENCIYNPVHDYSKDYLTFRITSGGTICWKSVGSGYAKTIEYSLNGGAWTSITAASTPPSISVAEGDVIMFRGTNQTYAGSKSNYSSFGHDTSGSTDVGSTAHFTIEGNIMSLIYGDNFSGHTTFNGGTYNLCSIFKRTNVESAENLVLPATTLTNYCYRAMFSLCPSLMTPPQLPATTLAQGCYWYMFEGCPMTTAPDLLAETLVRECYGYMFTGCRNLNYIKCLATNVASPPASALTGWVTNVAATGTFVKDTDTTWSTGNNGIPNGWTIYDNTVVASPVITYDGFNTVSISCATQGADIYYNVNHLRSYTLYTAPFTISDDSYVEAYAILGGQSSNTLTQNCVYVSDVPVEASNRDIKYWTNNGQTVTTPYSVNAIDGHSSSYSRGTFNFESSFALRQAQPAYLWFQHADQSASVYIDDTLVEKHWGGYTAFFVDISNYVHSGTNNVKVALKNNEGNNLAPAGGDFNFNATLGNVKLLTSPCLPAMKYGYDGFHITSDVATSSATIYVKTTVPTGATLVCTISGTNCNYTSTSASTGEEMTFSTTISNPHLWGGTADPYLYDVKLEIYNNNVLYHSFERPYGLRFYEYVFNETINGNPYTGFLLNGSPYLLRGVCMHDDIDGKANALSASDYEQEFNIIQELGCNFIRLAHYPHPKEVYDNCDRLGIVVQTEAPCVNKLQSTMPSDYYTHLEGQYTDMVNQHYNHPCIFFWGLSNETTTDDKDFGKTKIEGYTTLIRSLDSERMVGYVMSHSWENPSAYYNNPDVDWFGCNIYTGWYIDQNSNNPSNRLNTRINNIITTLQKPMAYSEYGCGGTQRCHSDNFMSTTTRGNNERHDIEYQMWLHEGHIATIKNYPQLMFTAQWQLFDIAVANRNEGYTVCLDGENTTTDDNLRRLNNKGLVERDHITKKDTFYLYKAWWNPTPFVHICGKDYTKTTDRVIKCYTNDGASLSLYVNNTFVETVSVTDNIATFTATNFNNGDVVRVEGTNTNDTLTFGS